MTSAIVGIGVGPGDPGLITVRAVEALGRVGAVLAPVSHSGGKSLALDIVRPHLSEGCEVRTTHLPMSEDRVRLESAWDEAAATLRRLAASSPAAFVTLGDAMLYSTWSYVLAALRRADPDVVVETIPGVTAMAACAAAVGQPLAEGREPLLVWPDEPPPDADKLFDLAPNVVFMKAGRHLAALADMAERTGAHTVAVRRASQAGALATADLRSWARESEYLTTVLMRKARSGAPCGAPSPTSCDEGVSS